jgi:peptide/nickel transport system permease protein
MGRRFVSRFVQSIVVMLGVATVIFLLLRITPGSPAETIAGSDATPQTIHAVAVEYHLTGSVLGQYLHWIGSLVTGHLGTSLIYQLPVARLIGQSMEPTLQLVLAAMIIGVPCGILLGVTAAVHQRGPVDLLINGFNAAVFGMPAYWLGLILTLVFAVSLHLLPPAGYANIFESPIQGLKTLALPAITLAVGVAGVQSRFVRSAMIDALSGDYVRTARAKGASERRVIWVHALRNALLPMITITGMQVGALLSGVVVVETVFTQPGLGLLVSNAIENRDYPVVQGVTLVLVAVFLLINLAADMLYGVVDPRTRRHAR